MSRTIKGLTGTVSVTQFSATVTGSGTDWDTSMEGKYIRIGRFSRWYVINQVASTTSLTLTERYQEPTASGVQFVVGDSEHFSAPTLIEEPDKGVQTGDDVGVFRSFDNSGL